MKHLYIALAASLLSLSVQASVEPMHINASKSEILKASNLKVETLSQKMQRSLPRTMTANELPEISGRFSKTNSHGPGKAPARAPEATDWQSIGTGIWCEDLFTVISDLFEGGKWNVDIETSESNQGWYRLIPYGEGSAPAEILGQPDTEYVYINASNPEAVYIEDFIVYNSWMFSQIVPENQWDMSNYGTLEDGVISFQKGSFAITEDGESWERIDGSNFKIYLPGAEYKDYSLSLSVDTWCTVGDAIGINVKCGDDVTSIKFINSSGYFTASDDADIQNFVNQNGYELPAFDGTIPLDEIDINSIYSVLAVALNEDGKVVNAAECQFFRTADENEKWETIGSGKLDEAIYSVNYSDLPLETMDVTVERSLDNPSNYRIVNPYANHSMLSTNQVNHTGDHNHYMYISTTAAGRIFVDHSPTGLDLGYGEGAILSTASLYADTDLEDAADAQLGCFGTLADNVITIPDDVLGLGELDYKNGAFYLGNKGFRLELPDDSQNGLQTVEVNNDLNAPVEYYNLQGVRIAAPEAGSLVIKRQGTTVNKSIAR